MLLDGPSGSGKTLVARVIHDNSGARGDFVAVNCSHLTAERALVDLFGARDGAYTGQRGARDGLVEAAQRGTLFLDEVDALPACVQAQLLCFLQDRTYRRVGDTATRHAREVRVIAATNRDPRACVESGDLREDLFYRLDQFRIRLPSLADRPSDLPLLAHALVARAAEELAVRPLPLTASAMAWLEEQEWPGNVRDLENAVRTGLIWARCEQSEVIRVRHLRRDPQETPVTPSRVRLPLKEAAQRFRQRYARAVLTECGGNRSEAARRLGIHRSSLYDLLSSDSR